MSADILILTSERRGDDLEMSEKLEIMRAIQESFAHPPEERGNDDKWTRALLTKLCEIGRINFACKVRANRGKVDRTFRDRGEWLYDVTWLKYNNDRLIDVPLVAECEWGNFNKIKDDFQKLLLARAGVRLMVYNGCQSSYGSRAIAEELAQNVMGFNYRQEGDAWLLAAWERAENQHKFIFRYFTIDPRDGAVTEI